MSTVVYFCAQIVLLCILYPTIDTAAVTSKPPGVSTECDFIYLGSVDSTGKITLPPAGKAVSKAAKGEKRYYLCMKPTRWDDAFPICKNMNGGLVSVESSKKEDMLEKFLSNFTDITVWTSGRLDSKVGRWYFGVNTWSQLYSFGDHIKFKEGPAFRIAYHKDKKSHWDSWLFGNRFEYICEI